MARIDALGDDEERAGLLVALLRRGQLSPRELKLRVWLYDPAARLAWEGLGETELPPTPEGVKRAHYERGRAKDPGRRERPLPADYLHRLFGRAWAVGVAPLGVAAAARVSLAAFRVAETRLPLEVLPEVWPDLARAAERWLAGDRDEVGDFDAFQHDLAPNAVDERRPARGVAMALAVTFGSMTEIGAAEGAGTALTRVAEIWHGAEQSPGQRELTAPDLQAALRRHLPPSRVGSHP